MMLQHKTESSSAAGDDEEILTAHPESSDKLWNRIRKFLQNQTDDALAENAGAAGDGASGSSLPRHKHFRKASLRPIRSEFRSQSPHSCCRESDRSLMQSFLRIKPIRRCFTCKRGFCDIEEHHVLSADLYKQLTNHCACSRSCPRHWKGRIATEAAIGAGLLHAETGKNIRFRDDDDSSEEYDDGILFTPKAQEKSQRNAHKRNGHRSGSSDKRQAPGTASATFFGQVPYLAYLPLWLHKLLAWGLLTILCAWLCLKIQYVLIKHMPWEAVAKWLQYALNPGLLPWRLIKRIFHPTFRIHPTIKLSEITSLYAKSNLSELDALEEKLMHLLLPLKGGWIVKQFFKPISMIFSRPFKDGSDGQWRLWLHQMPMLICCAAVHISLTRTLNFILKWFGKNSSAIKELSNSILQIILGTLAILICHNPIDCIIIGFIIVGFYGISLLTHHTLTRWLAPWLTWIFCMTILVICSWASIPNYRSAGHHYPLRKLAPILVLKLVSYNIDKFWAYKHKSVGGVCETYEECEAIADDASLGVYETIGKTHLSTHKFNVVNYLGYVLYLPLWIAGPIIPFQAFIYQLNHPYRPALWRDGLLSIIKLISLTILIEYVFSRTMLVSIFFGSTDTQGVSNPAKAFQFMWPLLSPIEILTGITCALIYLWLKFKIIWGTFRSWSLLAGIHTPDNLPRFLFNHVSMQDFWRSWHLSYHLWLRRYIYAPLRKYSLTRSLSVILVYFFVGAWHQINLGFSVWASVVSLTAFIEFAVEHAYRINYKQRPLPIPQSGFFKAFTFIALSTFIVQMCMFANALGYAIGTKGFMVLARDFIDRPISWSIGLLCYSVVAYIWCALILRQASLYRMVTFEKPKTE